MSINTAQWIVESKGCEAPVFRKSFNAGRICSAVLDICGLGWYELYINGKAADDTLMNPVVATYEQLGERKNNYGIKDVFLSPRVYYRHYDVTKLLLEGTNLLAVMLGNGWFNQHEQHAEGSLSCGTPRLAFSLEITNEDGSRQLIESDESTRAAASHITRNNLYFGETQKLKSLDDFFSLEYDDSAWRYASQTCAPEGVLTEQNCPVDRIIRSVTPTVISEKRGVRLYDVGENISGYIEFDTVCAGKITIEYAEEITKSGRLNCDSIGGRNRRSIDVYHCDGRSHIGLHPHFNWHGFRYFTVKGEISNPVCRVIHTDIAVTSSFKCENEVVNWLYDAYIRTQLSNIHGCVPSDCPHRERLGYTGDGQLCCESAMLLLDSRGVYEKWMQDIVDCQSVNGHIQHTAPFFGGGGGPCGWGGAVVVVPYFFWKQFGDADFVRRYYVNIVKWFEYIETRCENGLVVCEEKGWCLGDWCVPDLKCQGEFQPAFVNTSLLVKFYGYLVEIEHMLGIEIDRSSIIEQHKTALSSAYYDRQFDIFCGNRFGADAFGIDIGLGNEVTLKKLVGHYERLGYFDTGIFGTDILLRVLFETGNGQTAVKLLTSQVKEHSFGYMRECGATTLWEYFNGHASHSHPMFGGCVKLLTQYLLGIRSLEPGWNRFIVAPYINAVTGSSGGHITTPNGIISVNINVEGEQATVKVNAYNGANGEFVYGEVRKKLMHGENVFKVKIKS